jgi:DNA-directed RNA polymerase subunit RPC12/RpoP
MKEIVETFTQYDHNTNSNYTHTRVRCTGCGAEITPKGSPTTKRVLKALTDACRHCSGATSGDRRGNWWSAFGLDKNPYVYGPMPYKRTSEFWRRVEARERGWMSWKWSDCNYRILEV